MKSLTFVICCLFVFLIACTTHKHQLARQLAPIFNNQGDQENYLVNKFFEDSYKKEKFPRYNGSIQLEGNILRYGNDTVNIGDTSVLRLVFTSGIIYPKLFKCNKLGISDVEEKSPSNLSIKIKRFEFWAFLPRMANPTVYVFELTNEKATKDMPIAEFIKGAKLTFFKEGWIII